MDREPDQVSRPPGDFEQWRDQPLGQLGAEAAQQPVAEQVTARYLPSVSAGDCPPLAVFHPTSDPSRVTILSCGRMLSHTDVSDSATPWTAALEAPLSMGFSRQEYWSGLPFPPPGDLPDSGIEPLSPALSDGFFATELPGKPVVLIK